MGHACATRNFVPLAQAYLPLETGLWGNFVYTNRPFIPAEFKPWFVALKWREISSQKSRAHWWENKFFSFFFHRLASILSFLWHVWHTVPLTKQCANEKNLQYRYPYFVNDKSNLIVRKLKRGATSYLGKNKKEWLHNLMFLWIIFH